jgi:hypothetical protein
LSYLIRQTKKELIENMRRKLEKKIKAIFDDMTTVNDVILLVILHTISLINMKK